MAIITWPTLHATKLQILQSSIKLVILRDKLCDAKIWATLTEETDWYGNRSVSVPPRNRKFPGRRNSLRVPDHARFRASPWFTWLSRNLAAALPWQRPQGPGIPGSSRDPLFLVLSRFPRSEWLSPIFSFYACTLNFRLSLFLPNLFHTFLVPSFCLYKTVTVFQIHTNLLMSASSLFPNARFLFYISRYFSASLSFFLLLVCLYLFD